MAEEKKDTSDRREDRKEDRREEKKQMSITELIGSAWLFGGRHYDLDSSSDSSSESEMEVPEDDEDPEEGRDEDPIDEKTPEREPPLDDMEGVNTPTERYERPSTPMPRQILPLAQPPPPPGTTSETATGITLASVVMPSIPRIVNIEEFDTDTFLNESASSSHVTRVSSGIPCPSSDGVPSIEAKPILAQCVSCGFSQIQTVNFPCMHACFCIDCAQTAVKFSRFCPSCRQDCLSVCMLYLCYSDVRTEVKTNVNISNEPEPPAKRQKTE